MRKKTSYLKKCLLCPNFFKAYLYEKDRCKYCSVQCKNKSKVGISLSQSHRNNISKSNLGRKMSIESKIKMSNAKKGKKMSLEARKNMSEAHIGKWTGDKSPLWKGGFYPLHRTIRECNKTKEWRSKIFERDDYTCQECGVKNKKGLGKNDSTYPNGNNSYICIY